MPQSPAMDHTLLELRDAIASGAISSTDAVNACLAKIEAHADLNAFREVFADEARQRAADVDAGKITGPLAGVPIAIKDLMSSTLGRTSCSSKMLEDFRSPFNGTVTQRLLDAGAIIIGKTNMDEFAMGSSSETCAFGVVRNPHDPERTPGGSSGGAAAAMGAGLCAGSFGSDTGGSIRQPAALCGVVGFKPTYGRVSRYGLVAFASSLDQIGPLTATVADAAALYAVVAGHDPLDSTSVDVPIEADVADVDQSPVPRVGSTLRIGLAKQYMNDANHPAVTAAVERASDIYRQAGAEIVEIDLPNTEYGIPAYYIVAPAEASSNLARYDGVHYGHRTELAPPADENAIQFLYAQSRAEGFGPEVQRRIMLGTYALSAGYDSGLYNRALCVRRVISDELAAGFEQCDAILCPTTTGPAFKLGELMDDPIQMYLNDIYTVNANLAGTPGISIPAGTANVDGKELPVGVQLLGPAFGERELFRIARIAERGLS